MKQHDTSRPGFSLLEMLAVCTILGIIAAIILPRIVTSTDRAKESTCNHSRAEINITVERYYVETGNWPANDLSDIAADADYFPDGIPTCPVTGQLYRLDPLTHRVVGHAGTSDHSP